MGKRHMAIPPVIDPKRMNGRLLPCFDLHESLRAPKTIWVKTPTMADTATIKPTYLTLGSTLRAQYKLIQKFSTAQNATIPYENTQSAMMFLLSFSIIDMKK